MHILSSQHSFFCPSLSSALHTTTPQEKKEKFINVMEHSANATQVFMFLCDLVQSWLKIKPNISLHHAFFV